jgi:outer membrane protein OmpA-like peptidoglycan-associated protein
MTIGPSAAGDRPTEAQILDALKARRLTRCPHPPPTLGCGEAGSQSQQALPSPEGHAPTTIDIEIPFRYASAALGAVARSKLAGLGPDLSTLETADTVLLVAGHTDASGNARYNLGLSQRRAEAASRYLADHFKLAPEQVRAVGFGETQLKNSADPFAAENRRVEVVSIRSNR